MHDIEPTQLDLTHLSEDEYLAWQYELESTHQGGYVPATSLPDGLAPHDIPF